VVVVVLTLSFSIVVVDSITVVGDDTVGLLLVGEPALRLVLPLDPPVGFEAAELPWKAFFKGLIVVIELIIPKKPSKDCGVAGLVGLALLPVTAVPWRSCM